jgi:hypothetical protein
MENVDRCHIRSHCIVLTLSFFLVHLTLEEHLEMLIMLNVQDVKPGHTYLYYHIKINVVTVYLNQFCEPEVHNEIRSADRPTDIMLPTQHTFSCRLL